MANESGHLPHTRRAFTRIPADIAVEIVPDGGEPLHASVHDVSFSGVAVKLENPPLTRGMEVDLTLLPDGASEQVRLPGRGRVVRVGPGITAFTYTALDGDVYEQFERLVLLIAPDPEVLEMELRNQGAAGPSLPDPLRRPGSDG